MNKASSAAVAYMMATIVSAMIGLLAVPITTRLFGPEEWGIISIFSSILAIGVLVSCLGLDQAYLRFFPETQGSGPKWNLLLRLARGSFVGWLGTSVVLIGLCTLYANSRGITSGWLAKLLVALVVATLFGVVHRFALIQTRNFGHGRAFLVLTIIYALATKGALILGGFVWHLALPSIWLLTGGMAVSALLGLAFVRSSRPQGILAGEADVHELPAMGEIYRYSIPFLGSGLLLSGTTLFMPVFVSLLLGLEEVGKFTAALSVAGIVGVLQTGLLMFWTPYAFANYRVNPGSLRKIQQLAVTGSALLGLVLIAARTPIFQVVGSEYRDASSVFGFILLALLLNTVAEVSGIGLLIGKRSGIYALSQGIGTLVSLGIAYSLAPRLGLNGVGLGMMFGAVLVFFLRVVVGARTFAPFTGTARASLTIIVLTIAGIVGSLDFGAQSVRAIIIVLSFGMVCGLGWKELRQSSGLVRSLITKRVSLWRAGRL